jgi:uncharacterized protein
MEALVWGRSLSLVLSEATGLLRAAVIDVCLSHGVDHARAVLQHTKRALEEHPVRLGDEKLALIQLAALLHDADDHKFFPAPPIGQPSNASTILQKCSGGQITPEQETAITEMIDWVSCSKHHNDIPQKAIQSPELLFPRWSDRLEALGEIGAIRCLQFAASSGNLLFVPTTPRPRTEEELETLIDPERFRAYQGGSASMMDHYYDKLLHLGHFQSGNSYLDAQARSRGQILRDICLHFGREEQLHPLLVSFAKENQLFTEQLDC